MGVRAWHRWPSMLVEKAATAQVSCIFVRRRRRRKRRHRQRWVVVGFVYFTWLKLKQYSRHIFAIDYKWRAAAPFALLSSLSGTSCHVPSSNFIQGVARFSRTSTCMLMWCSGPARAVKAELLSGLPWLIVDVVPAFGSQPRLRSWEAYSSFARTW